MFKKLFEKSKQNQVKPLSYHKDYVVILDNGHGDNTPGKRSPKFPDGSQFFEYEFNRDIVHRIAQQLDDLGIRYEILVPEKKDIPLKERCDRANRIYKQTKKKCFLISVHANAAGNGSTWINAKGWAVYTSVGKTKSDDMATIMWNEMKNEFPTRKMRLDMTDGDVDYEANFTVLYNTLCPAILTENFFMDDKEECKEILMNNAKRQKIANAHVNAIKKILMNLC